MDPKDAIALGAVFVALASVVVTGIVAVGTFLQTSARLRQDAAEAEARRQHERDLARVERHQGRVGDFYLELRTYALNRVDYIAGGLWKAEKGEWSSKSDPTHEPEADKVRGRADLYASAEVRQRLDVFHGHLGRVWGLAGAVSADGVFQRVLDAQPADGDPIPSGWIEAKENRKREAHEALAALGDAADELLSAMRRDLGDQSEHAPA
jgi:hypothetical protein